jgi:hypothetical protein
LYVVAGAGIMDSGVEAHVLPTTGLTGKGMAIIAGSPSHFELSERLTESSSIKIATANTDM